MQAHGAAALAGRRSHRVQALGLAERLHEVPLGVGLVCLQSGIVIELRRRRDLHRPRQHRGRVGVEPDLVPVLAREDDEDGEEGLAEGVEVVARGPVEAVLRLSPGDLLVLGLAREDEGVVHARVIVLGARVAAAEELHAEQRPDEDEEQHEDAQVHDRLERLDEGDEDDAQVLPLARELEHADDAEGAQHRHGEEGRDGRAREDAANVHAHVADGDDDDHQVEGVERVHLEDLPAEADELDRALEGEDEREQRVEEPERVKERGRLVARAARRVVGERVALGLGVGGHHEHHEHGVEQDAPRDEVHELGALREHEALLAEGVRVLELLGRVGGLRLGVHLLLLRAVLGVVVGDGEVVAEHGEEEVEDDARAEEHRHDEVDPRHDPRAVDDRVHRVHPALERDGLEHGEGGPQHVVEVVGAVVGVV